MINFPIFNSIRSIRENNRARKADKLKAGKETAKVAQQKAVKRVEPQQRAKRDGAEAQGQGKNKARFVDVEV